MRVVAHVFCRVLQVLSLGLTTRIFRPDVITTSAMVTISDQAYDWERELENWKQKECQQFFIAILFENSYGYS